jgi:hypothetical protein
MGATLGETFKPGQKVPQYDPLPRATIPAPDSARQLCGRGSQDLAEGRIQLRCRSRN